jgi:ABC-2 type transport system permease protein
VYKYIFIYKTSFLESIQYVLNIIFRFITFFVMIFVFMNLWDYIYSDSSNIIGGYTKSQMIWYVITTEIIWFGSNNRAIMNQITTDIKSGNISYGINKPYHYIIFMITKYFGEITLRFVMFIMVGGLLGYLFVGPIDGFKWYRLPLIILITLLGLLINISIRMIISILSFWMEDSTPFHWVYDKFIIVLGTIFPVEVFPLWARGIITMSPIYVVNYGPAKLTVDFSSEVFHKVIVAQIIYVTISFGLLMFLYKKGVKKLNVNGG